MESINRTRDRVKAALALAAVALTCATVAPRPARADGAASTRNIILGAAAAIAADVIYNNIHHKQVRHDTIVGRTNDGGTVYGDGRVVYPSGDVLYTGNGGQRCTYDGYGNPCGNGRPVVYYPRQYNGHDHGNHYGQQKHHRNDDEQGDGDRGHGKHGDRGDRGRD